MNELINVKTYILELTRKIGYMANPFEDFIIFMEDNNWFQIDPIIQDSEGEPILYFKKSDAEKIESKVLFFFKNKDASLDERNIILFDELVKKFPATTANIREYETSNPISNNIRTQIIDFLLAYLKKDLFLYSDDDMEALDYLICEELTIVSGNVLVEFIYWLKVNHKTQYKKHIILNSRNTESRTKQAYDSDKYLQLIYFLFHPGYIDENSMYELATENKNMVDTWLYLSLHLICPLRDTDLIKLPHPRLKNKPEDIFKAVTDNQFTDSDALLVVNSVLWQIKNISVKPNKVLSDTLQSPPTANYLLLSSA